MSASPNFTRLDTDRPEISRLMIAMLGAREALGNRPYPLNYTSEEWWADVLADPRARIREGRSCDLPLKRAFYTLADEKSEIILVACNKCDWKAAFVRDELIASHGTALAMPSLLRELAPPDCPRMDNQWDGCGVRFVNPIETESPNNANW
jgi:hypothetical protein